MTATRDFQLANNQSWYAEFELINDEVSPPEIHQLTAAKVRLMLRRAADYLDVKVDVSTPSDAFAVLSLDEAIVRLNITGKVMRSISPDDYEYDIVVSHPSGRVYRPVAGTLHLTLGVTELP